MRVVVPAQPIVAECQQRQHAHDAKHRDSELVADAARCELAPRGHGDGCCEARGRTARLLGRLDRVRRRGHADLTSHLAVLTARDTSRANVPIPKFASLCGTLVRELRSRRTLATY